jgi:tRNA(His) 5'-end guanylyltransferase
MVDELGNRMKSYYEDRAKTWLPRRSYSIIRIDGKAFHTYTRGMKKPFDEGLMTDMDGAAMYLCKNIQGAKFAFVQSDEISILMTDFDEIGTDAWFDGNVQKVVSVAASIATAKFNQLRTIRQLKHTIGFNYADMKLAEFDARVFTIPSNDEVKNYFIWRQQDTVRNSISSVAQTLYSHRELNGKNMNVQQEMIFQKGINWNDFTPQQKRGRFIKKEVREMETPFVKAELQQKAYQRTVWVSSECPTFTQDKIFLDFFVPDL